MIKIKTWTQILTGVVIFLVLSASSGYITLVFITRGGNLLIPDVRGKDIVTALRTLQGKKLYGIVETEKFHPTAPRNTIIGQRPLPGDARKEYATVRLVLSAGPESTEMPDLKHYGIRQARIESSRQGAGAIEEVYIHHQVFRYGEVITHIPGPGEVAFPGGPVKFLISLGPQQVIYRMPDCIGKSLTEVRYYFPEILEPDIVFLEPKGLEPGIIMGQNPLPFEPLDITQKVHLEVSPENTDLNEDLSVFIFTVPQGLLPKNIKIIYRSDFREETVFDKSAKPSEIIRLLLPKTGMGTLFIYQDDILISSEEW